MATRGESLIRQFCEARTREVEEEAKGAIKRLPERIKIAQLPNAQRRAIEGYRRARRALNAAEKVLEQHGLDTYAVKSESRDSIPDPTRDRLVHQIHEARAARVNAIRKLRDAGYIAVMGATPANARGAVEQLQADLAKI